MWFVLNKLLSQKNPLQLNYPHIPIPVVLLAARSKPHRASITMEGLSTRYATRSQRHVDIEHWQACLKVPTCDSTKQRNKR